MKVREGVLKHARTSISLDLDLLKWVDEIRGDVPRSKFIEAAIRHLRSDLAASPARHLPGERP